MVMEKLLLLAPHKPASLAGRGQTLWRGLYFIGIQVLVISKKKCTSLATKRVQLVLIKIQVLPHKLKD